MERIEKALSSFANLAYKNRDQDECNDLIYAVKTISLEFDKIWQAIDELQNQGKKPISFANDINPCPQCDCGGITRITAKVMEQGDYRTLYEKEKSKVINITMFVFKLSEKVNQEQNHHEMISHTRSTTTVISAKKEQLEMILQKMQELEAG